MSNTSLINHTGTRLAHDRLEEMLDTDNLIADDESGRGPTDMRLRMSCIEEAEPIGSPSDQPLDPSRSALLDSLGGRLAFERGGARHL